MNGRFEVVSEFSLEELRLIYSVYFLKKHKASNVIRIIIGVLTLLVGSVVVVSAWPIDNARGAVYGIIYLGLSAAMIFLPIYRARLVAKRVFKQHTKSNLSTQGSRTITEAGVESTSAEMHSLYRWNQITDGYLYKNRIVFFIGNNVFSINLGNITNGSPDELLAFVRKRVPIK